MAPLGRDHPDLASVEGKSCREAAVLALFYPNGALDEARVHPASLLLTLRQDGMPDHAGQIAFPGGRREQGEDLEGTALRETEEEMAICRQDIELLGPLTPLFIPPSSFCVYPFVGAVREMPDLSVVSNEVAGAFGIPVSDLTDPGVRRRTNRTIRGEVVEVPHFDLAGRFIWGATAMMMAELIALITCGAGESPGAS